MPTLSASISVTYCFHLLIAHLNSLQHAKHEKLSTRHHRLTSSTQIEHAERIFIFRRRNSLAATHYSLARTVRRPHTLISPLPKPAGPTAQARMPFVSTTSHPLVPNLPVRLQSCGNSSASLHAVRLSSAFSSATR